MTEKSSFKNSRGHLIATYSSVPDGPSNAGILLVHGYAEHAGRYRHVIKELNENGYAVFAVDHQGHGHSEGTRSDIKYIDDFVEDLNEYYSSLKKNSDIKRWFVLGHSMGGAIALKFTVLHQNELSGMILTAPMIRIDTKIPGPVQKVVRYIASFVPALPVVKIDVDALSRDPEVVKNYKTDPLVYNGRLRARMGLHFSDINRQMPDFVRQIRLPFWTGHGTLDRITSPEGSKMLYEQSPSDDKTLKMYDGLFHEILNEPERDQVIGEISIWIKKHLDKSDKKAGSQNPKK